jgi:hypothetical protein
MWLRQAFRRARGLLQSRAAVRGFLFALTALVLAGCASGEAAVTGSIPRPAGQTIAFESIDGPPRPVFERLVSALSAEADKRQLPVVSHTGPATWRVRAYLAAHVEKKKKQATLTWVWEVFDGNQSRAFRLTGEEPLGNPGTDAWALCHDELLRRIAAKGFDQLSARIGGLPAEPAPTVEPRPAGPAVAFADPRQ